jgi:glycosyltransferase involved in cell wall biosynthesis
VVIHTDGLGWKRRKWGPWFRRYYRWVEWVCARFVGTIVTDNPAMKDYYLTHYNADSTYIPYGAHNHAGIDNSVLEELHLRPNSFLLVVARLEKENNTDLIIREFVSSGCEMPLLIVGDSPYGKEYLLTLQHSGNEKVHFAGRIDDQAKLNSLYESAYLYIHGHEVGGTNPSLLRAMDAGVAPLVIDVSFNRAVIADCGYVFTNKEGNLAGVLRELSLQSNEVKRTGERAKIRAEREFQWESVVSCYAKLFMSVAGKK